MSKDKETFADIYANLTLAALMHEEMETKAQGEKPATQTQIAKLAKAYISLTKIVEDQIAKTNCALAQLTKVVSKIPSTIGDDLVKVKESIAETKVQNDSNATNFNNELTKLSEQMDYLESMEVSVIELSGKLDALGSDVSDIKSNQNTGADAATVAAITQMSHIIVTLSDRLTALENGKKYNP